MDFLNNNTLNFNLKQFFICFTIMFFCCKINGQSIEIDGKVTDLQGKPLSNVSVTVKSLSKNTIIQYGSSDANGNYSLKLTTEEPKILIKASRFNYKTIVDTILVKPKNSYNFILEEATTSIKEIVVKSKKIKDTMKIKTDSLNLNERSTLRDILNKTEGFNVSNEGGISYRGKQINKVLINKKEVFVNQNKIALDNLDYQIMNNLELINNHKDKFNMTFDSNVESVLNVNTKKEFKGVLKSNIDMGYGFNNSFLVKSKAMFFSDQFNAFLTHNTNTIGKKDFSFEDIGSAFKSKSSGFFKENFSTFFLEDELQRNAFDSNTSFTLRKENAKNKLGIVVYYNYLDFNKRDKNVTQKLNEEIVRDQASETNKNGQSVITSLAFVNKINNNRLLFFNSDLAFSKIKKSGDINILNFFPTQNSSKENNIFDINSSLLNFDLNLKNRINEKTIFLVGIQSNFEKSSQNFDSNFIIDLPVTITQSFNFKTLYFKTYWQWNRKINDNSHFSFDINSSNTAEDLTVNLKQSRQVVKNDAKFYYHYKNDTGWDISIDAAPVSFQFLTKGKRNNFYLINSKSSFSYVLTQSKTLRLEFNQDHTYLDLYKNIDTLKLSFNNRLINEQSLAETISRYRELSLGYYYSSIIKGKSFYVNSVLSENTNHLQPILNKIENNIFYYNNKLLDSKQDALFVIGGSKSFYLTKYYHQLNFSGNYNFNISKVPTFIGDEQKKYTIENQIIRSNISFEPKKMFFTEIVFSATLNKQKLFLEDSKINKLNSITYDVGILRKKDDFEFAISLGKKVNRAENFSFEIPYFSFYSNLKISKKMNGYIKGKYLFHLLNIPNTENTDLNIFSDGNFIYTNSNQNNLNYLLFGLTYKF